MFCIFVAKRPNPLRRSVFWMSSSACVVRFSSDTSSITADSCCPGSTTLVLYSLFIACSQTLFNAVRRRVICHRSIGNRERDVLIAVVNRRLECDHADGPFTRLKLVR